MKKLIWGLALIGLIGLAAAAQKRCAQPSDASEGPSRVRRAMAARPQLPTMDVGDSLEEAVKEAAGEVAPSSGAA